MTNITLRVEIDGEVFEKDFDSIHEAIVYLNTIQATVDTVQDARRLKDIVNF